LLLCGRNARVTLKHEPVICRGQLGPPTAALKLGFAPELAFKTLVATAQAQAVLKRGLQHGLGQDLNALGFEALGNNGW
jgi:hypothetical protein